MQTDSYTIQPFSIHVAANLYRKPLFSIHIEQHTEAR